ncbi:ferritin-like domain-containing protein [Faecalimicrobium sp. JNUCC 81]
MNNYIYHANEPYPEIKVESKNPYYAELLMDDHSGIISEFSAISQYLYHSLDLGKSYTDLANMWLQISFIEMHHLDILSQVITLLGGKPKYRGSFSTLGQPWNGSFVYYGDNICDQLNVDLESEYQAISNYENHIRMIDDKYIKNILRRIILDEQIHIIHFKEAIKKYSC